MQVTVRASRLKNNHRTFTAKRPMIISVAFGQKQQSAKMNFTK